MDSHYCGKCKTTLTSVADFLIHKLQHVGLGKGFGCELCGQGYNRVAPLQDHYKRKHGIEILAKRHVVKAPAALSKERLAAVSATTVPSSASSSSTTASPALKHLLSTPFVGSINNSSRLHSLPEDVVYEEKLPSASRNLQSAKDKLASAHFGSLSRKTKLTPAESKMKPVSSLILSEPDIASTDNGIDLDSQETHLPSADVDLLSDGAARLLSTNLTSADVSLMSSANLNLSSVNTGLKTPKVNLMSADLDLTSAISKHLSADEHFPSVNVNLPSATSKHLSVDEHFPSPSVDLPSAEVPLSDEHLEPSVSSDVNLSDVETTDLVTSDVMFNSHSMDASSTSQHLTSDVQNLVPAELSAGNLNPVAEKTVLEKSDNMHPAKTVHIVIAKTGENEIPMDDDSCGSLDNDGLEMVVSESESNTGRAHPVKARCGNTAQNKNEENGSSGKSDIIQATSKISNGQSLKPDFHFILLANLVKGRVLSYRRNQFKCLHCEYKTMWINSLMKHMKTFHEDMMSIHEHIEVKSMDTSPDRKLVKMSTYIAELRNLKKFTRIKKQRGMETQDQLGEFSCKMCDKTFSRLRYLRKHMDVHCTDKKHLCDECGKSFKTKSYLVSHHRVHKTKEYRCSQCDFRSSINAVIHAHRQLHHEDSVLCDICGFAYNDKSTLKKHKLVHDPSRPHACSFPGCTWRFKSKVMCLAHLRAHTSEGKFQCSLCSYVFRQNHHLQRHAATVHGIQKSPSKGKHKKSEQTEEQEEDNTGSVRLILDYSQMEVDNFPSMLQSGQLVIATDSEGNTVNYEVADITMNVALLSQDQEEETPTDDRQTVVIPNYDCGQIIFQGSDMA